MVMMKDEYKINQGSSYDFHIDDIEENADSNPLHDVFNRLEHQFHYRPEEVAIYHPTTSATLKMRNSGIVDLFATEDVGIRMSPKGQTMNIFANHHKSHLHHLTEWITGDSTSYVKKNRLVKTEGTTLVHSGKDMTIIGKESLHVTIDKNENVTIGGNSNVTIKGNATLAVHGNVNAKIDQHATIEVGKDLTVNSKNDIRISSGKDIRIDAVRDIVIDAGRHLSTYQRCPDPSHHDPKKTHK